MALVEDVEEHTSCRQHEGHCVALQWICCFLPGFILSRRFYSPRGRAFITWITVDTLEIRLLQLLQMLVQLVQCKLLK